MNVGERIALVLLILIAALAVACTAPGDLANTSARVGGASNDGETRIAASAASTPEATVGVASTAPESESTTISAPEETAGETTSDTSGATSAAPKETASTEPPFVASSEASGGSGLLADGILAVRYGVHEGYEQVVIDLGTGKEPAGKVPEWSLTSPTGDGLLRVQFPSVSMTAVSDGTFEGPLLKDFHVVRGPEGTMFVDVFAGEAFTYRAMELGDPARLVLDFKSSGMPLGVPLPAEDGKTVLVEPRRGSRIDGTFTVSGYSRNFEAANTVILTDSGGKTVARKTVQGSDWSSTWGYFETTIEASSFSGKGKLRVGAESARDGSFKGVEIPVRSR